MFAVVNQNGVRINDETYETLTKAKEGLNNYLNNAVKAINDILHETMCYRSGNTIFFKSDNERDNSKFTCWILTVKKV